MLCAMTLAAMAKRDETKRNETIYAMPCHVMSCDAQLLLDSIINKILFINYIVYIDPIITHCKTTLRKRI